MQQLLGGRKKKAPVLATFTSGFQDNADGLTITKPAGVVSGDLLIIVVSMATSGGGSTNPTGFTLLLNQLQGVFPAIQQNIYYRIADGTEGASFSTDLTGSAVDASWFCGRFNLNNTGAAPEGADGSAAANTSADPPSVSPTWGAGNQSLFLAIVSWNGAPGTTVSAYPTNYLGNQISITGANVDAGLAIATRNVQAASEDPGAYTLSAAQIHCVGTVAIRANV